MYSSTFCFLLKYISARANRDRLSAREENVCIRERWPRPTQLSGTCEGDKQKARSLRHWQNSRALLHLSHCRPSATGAPVTPRQATSVPIRAQKNLGHNRKNQRAIAARRIARIYFSLRDVNKVHARKNTPPPCAYLAPCGQSRTARRSGPSQRAAAASP